MQLIIIESPFSAKTREEHIANVEYARMCIADSLKRGEAPIASHLLYTQKGILNDKIPAQRTLGIRAGHAWMRVADQVVIYADRKLTPGMIEGHDMAIKFGVPIDYRKILEG